MTTFTIDAENNITAFATPDDAAAAVGADAQVFNSQKQLAELAAVWPANAWLFEQPGGCDPRGGVSKSAKSAASRIWRRIQESGRRCCFATASEKPKADKKAKGGARAAKGAPAKGKATKKASPAKRASGGKKIH